jgi:hypothetical protein
MAHQRLLTHYTRKRIKRQLRQTERPKGAAPMPRTDARGFIAWITSPHSRTRGFIVWAETAVADLSPNIQDAWHFPTAKAAKDSVSLAFGFQAKDYKVSIFPATQP